MNTKVVFVLLGILAIILSACGTPPAAAPTTPTLLPTQQTVIPTNITYPTFTPAPSATAISYPTWTPTPTNIPYPTTSTVNSNAVAFISRERSGYALWVANVDGSGERKLTDIENNAERTSNYLLKWSPDGKWISYISGDDLWIISPDGSVKRKVLLISKTDNKDKIWSCSWSPDSSKIAYIQTIDKKLTSRLLDLETGNVSELPISTDQLSLSWSPNGRYILLNTYRSLTVFEVATDKVLKEINLASSIDYCEILHYAPAWSPNSKWFYYPMYANGNYSMSFCAGGIDGSSKRIYISSSSRLPAWDKTGNFLYFTTQDTKQRLLHYNVRTQETKTILVLEVSEASKWSVSVSPQGDLLEMDGENLENLQSFIFLNLDSLSTTRFKIPEIPATMFGIDTTFWSADNQNLVFLSGEHGHLIFYRLDSQTGKTTTFSGEHSIETWIISPIATTP